MKFHVWDPIAEDENQGVVFEAEDAEDAAGPRTAGQLEAERVRLRVLGALGVHRG